MDNYVQTDDRRPSVPSIQTHIDVATRSSPYRLSAVPVRLASQNFTPPMTPREVTEPSLPSPPAFNNYLRALHSFNPQSGAVSSEDASLMNASLTEGDLILVHSIHANGWADGTVLNTGDRGWLPTNYCEPYDHPYLRVLLNALTQFWDLLGSNEDDNLTTFVRQDYIRGLIAGVRFLLERADCLHRDAQQVKKHVGVRRMRKGILADLSSLVQIAKRVQETINEPYGADNITILLEELVTKAFKVITRAVSFIDVWTLETTLDRGEMERRAGSLRSETPPVTASTTSNTHLFVDTGASETSGLSPMIDSAMELQVEKSIAPALVKPTEASSPQRTRQSCDGSRKRASVVFTPPDGHAAHRLSLIQRDNSQDTSGCMASEQLAQTHDLCISHIAGFIGHHLHSRPFSELAATTEKLVLACENMLKVVDEVRAHDPQKSQSVSIAEQDFRSKVFELADSIQEVRRTHNKPDDEVIILPDKSKHLIAIGTELIRNTGNCVVKTRQLIETIGDFELKTPILPIPRRPSQATTNYTDEVATSPVAITSSPKRLSRLSRKSVDLMPPPPPPKDPRSSIASTHNFGSFTIESSSARSSPDIPENSERDSQYRAGPASRPSSQQTTSAKHTSIAFELPALSIRSVSRTSTHQDGVIHSVTAQSSTGSMETVSSSVRDSTVSAVSEASTRATTPDRNLKRVTGEHDSATITSFASAGSTQSLNTDANSDVEVQVLHKTYANELTFNKDGQVTGGSLPALVEQLTTHDSAPDPVFVKAFFLTFRKFCQPTEVAQALMDRFDYIGDSKSIGHPVRLRIFNIFKHWLETYWNPEADKAALEIIQHFATHQLKPVLPSAGDRLVDLTGKVAAGYRDGVFAPGLGKIYMHTAQDERVPDSIISKQELNALRNANAGTHACSITDLNPVEVARQLTLMVSRIFCAIQPDELLAMEWTNPNSTKSVHAREMCLVSTDIAHMVGETILAPDDPKKRAQVIKHWCKVAAACLDLNNFDSVMGIMCSINSSVVQRLKKTWDHVSKKSRARIDELQRICDISLNYSNLRKAVDACSQPCLPFFGVYLTDLTFVFAGNARKRELPPGASGLASTTASDNIATTGTLVVSVINFDMYTRVARIIMHLQNNQTPYNLKEVPEMRKWLEAFFDRMRENAPKMLHTMHERSILVEPRSEDHRKMMLAQQANNDAAAAAAAAATAVSPTAGDGEERPKTAAGVAGRTQQVIDMFDFKLIKGSTPKSSESRNGSVSQANA